MSGPLLLVSTPGRSGSKSVVAATSILCWDARAVHEPLRYPLIHEAAKYAEGIIEHDWMVGRLRSLAWPEMAASWVFPALLPALVEAFPGCEFIHLHRDREATIASMVRNYWYMPWEDELPQVQYWRDRMGDAPDSWGWQTRPQDWRIRPDRLASPEMSSEGWAAMGQRERCGWWVDYTARQAAAVGIEFIDLADCTMPGWYRVVELAGIPPRWLPDLPFPKAQNGMSLHLKALDEAGERPEFSSKEEWRGWVDGLLTAEIEMPMLERGRRKG